MEETDPIGQNNFDPPSPGGGLSDLGGDFSRPTSPFDDGMPAPVLEETPQPIAGPSGTHYFPICLKYLMIIFKEILVTSSNSYFTNVYIIAFRRHWYPICFEHG